MAVTVNDFSANSTAGVPLIAPVSVLKPTPAGSSDAAGAML